MESKIMALNLPTDFAQGNAAFERGQYVEAINFYASSLKKSSLVTSHIDFNINLAATLLVDPHSSISSLTKPAELRPANQIERDSSDPDGWVSIGDDPYFHLLFDSGKTIGPGWYCVSVLIDAVKREGASKFYIDYGQGYSEAFCYNIPFKRNALATRVIYIEPGVVSVRFDPKEYQGRFKVNLIQWKEIDEARAIEMMVAPTQLDPVRSDESLVANFPKDENSESLAPVCVEYLYEEYSRIFDVVVDSTNYAEWIDTIEIPNLPSKDQARKIIGGLKCKPVISIVMPTYNTDEIYLRACIDSVLNQSYPWWELCVADDASTKPSVKKVLKEYETRDARIKVVYRKKNGHISLTSNSALELASGDFVALLDHDDTLAEHALLLVAQAVNNKSDAQIFYSDEDKLDKKGERFDPHFKSDWNPDLFYSQNYVSHLGVYKRSLLQAIGGFRAGVEGSQDYDLLLRCLDHVRADQIIHIPHVLYHWRTVEGSTALSSDQKSYTTDAGVESLRHHFSHSQPEVCVEPGPVANTYRVRWPLPEILPLVSLIIPTRDRRALTEVAVRSILEKTTYTNYEILILDNGSVELDTLEFFESIQQEDLRVKVIRYDYPFNYSAINNYGARYANGSLIGLINNDVEIISPEWLTEMVSHALRPEIGCVGAKLYFSNDTIQHAGVICSLGGVAGHSHKHFDRNHPGYFYRLLLTQNLSAVTAACLIIRKDVFDEVSGLDEENLKVAFNDVDFCLKVQDAGYRNLWTPYAELYHYESISRGAEDSLEKIQRFQGEINFMKNKWQSLLEHDPYYSANLTKDREDFSLRTR